MTTKLRTIDILLLVFNKGDFIALECPYQTLVSAFDEFETQKVD